MDHGEKVWDSSFWSSILNYVYMDGVPVLGILGDAKKSDMLFILKELMESGRQHMTCTWELYIPRI